MKKIIISCILFILLVGCGKTSKTEKDDYLSCNDSSNNNMIETEDGYYYVYDSCIYYADKTALDNWVPVCNKPSCLHNSYSCNASFLMDGMDEITQKDGKIYGIGNAIGVNPYVYELNIDGSGKKKIYEIPFGEGIQVRGFRSILFPQYLILHYGYLAEDGTYHTNLARLEEDGSFHILYEEIADSELGDLSLPATSVGVRGDKAIISTLLTKTDENVWNVLWRMDGNKPERVNVPEDIDIKWGYLTENTFTCFKKQEGFYQIDLISGEQELVMENQLEDSIGIVLTEKYFIEMNRYGGYKPEEAHLRFYNGDKWLEVELPEEVKESDKLFTVLSVASDRVFMTQLTENSNDFRSEIYYFMLNDDTPKLIYCDDVSRYGEKQEEEFTEETAQ